MEQKLRIIHLQEVQVIRVIQSLLYLRIDRCKSPHQGLPLDEKTHPE